MEEGREDEGGGNRPTWLRFMWRHERVPHGSRTGRNRPHLHDFDLVEGEERALGRSAVLERGVHLEVVRPATRQREHKALNNGGGTLYIQSTRYAWVFMDNQII